MLDLIATTLLMKKLVTPFSKWPAYKHGLIDERGNVLIKKKDRRTRIEQSSLSSLDVVALNLKKLIEKIPGGKTKLGSLAAAAWLLKEDVNNMSEEEIQDVLMDCIEEDVAVNNVGSGNIAGTTAQDSLPQMLLTRKILKRLKSVKRKDR